MTNEEFYKDELKKIMHKAFLNALAVDRNGKIGTCGKTWCSDCMFYTGEGKCPSKAEQWLKQEYIEPEQQVDWSKVEVDTPILVRTDEDEEWMNRYFAKFENGVVWSFCDGRTSWSARKNNTIRNDIISWEYAKLAESEKANEIRDK